MSGSGSSIANTAVGSSALGRFLGLGPSKSSISNAPVGKLFGATTAGANQPVGANIGLGINGSLLTNPSAITNLPVGATLGLGGSATPEVNKPPESPTPLGTATPISKATFKQNLDGSIQSNPLNEFWNPTYHFTLFMAGDADFLNAVKNLSKLQQINSNLLRVIIAESGVTGYNIRDVEINTVNAQNADTRSQKVTTLTMTITEPMGLSFLDAIYGAASYLQIIDYTKVNYFLQLKFTGYKEDGSFGGSPLPLGFKNGNQWTWSLKLNLMETKINEGGGQYTLHFLTTEGETVVLEKQIGNKIPDGLTVKGKTLGDIFDSYAKAFNEELKKEYKDQRGKSLLEIEIKTHPVPWAGMVNPKDFRMVNKDKDDGYSRALALDFKDGPPTGHIPGGMHVNDFITSAIKATEQGQTLIKDEPIPSEIDASDTDTNPKKMREVTLFAIEPVIDNVRTDTQKTGNYIKHVTLHVVPTYSQNVILTRTQVNDAEKPQVQREMVQKLIQRGLVRKRYDYVFTGLNTEVLDFHIDFNLSWQARLPKLAGVRASETFVSVNGRYNPDPSIAPHVGACELQKENKLLTASFNPAIADHKTIYIEDILNQVNQNQPTLGPNGTLPISFVPAYLDFEHEIGTGFIGQENRGQPTAGAVFAQVFENTMTTAFQRIELTIRGDPYWLGQDNITRRIALQSDGDVSDPSDLPDFSTGNPAILVHFRYPLQLSDEFKPILRESDAFNGLYEVTTVKHNFADGAFKQTVSAVRMPLINLSQALTADPNTIGNDQSSPSVAQNNPSGNQGNPSSGQTPGDGSTQIAPTGSLPNSQVQQQRAQESFDFWVNKGYSPAAAAGMVAQEEAESSFDWTRTGDSGAAKGAFQWHPDRQAAILAGTGINVADPNTTHEQQLEAAYYEQTQGGEQAAGKAIRAAASGGEAGSVATLKYERPANTQQQAQIRGGRGQFWQNQFTKTTVIANNNNNNIL